MHRQIPLSDLKHSPDNVRKVKSSRESIAQLAASIQSKGLLHNLVVVENGRGYNVIDGNRRLDALNKVYKDKKTPINCIVLESNDNEVGLHANMMREDMHPLDESDVIQALVSDGSEDFDSVAKRFGQTKRWVEQRVSLSELSDKSKEMFRAYRFNLAVAQALTLGNHEKQDEYLDQDFETFHAESVKRAMTEQKIPVSAALFDIEAERANLEIESDLFGGEEYITNRNNFERLQESHIFSVCQNYRKEYMDVIYLKDQYHWDSPECRTLDSVYDDDHGFAKQDMIMVVTYNSYQYRLDTKEMVLKDIKEAQEAQDEAVEEEEEEVTPLTYSNPQRDLLSAYFADYSIDRLWSASNAEQVMRLMKSLLIHRKLGYTYSAVHRVGHIYADNQVLFPQGETPDGYTEPTYISLIEKHKDLSNDAFEADGTSPLSYCMSLSDEKRDQLFIACCLTGLSRYDMQAEALTNFTGSPETYKGWFKPDETWINKYKSNQLSMLEDYLFGKVSNDSRANRVKAIKDELAENPVFDPYGSWPQFKPQ
jgi:ParB/RepB/Spo0J family partition protein